MFKKIFLLVGFISCVFVFLGCQNENDKELSIYKDEIIASINIYYETFDNKSIEYSYLFIENEIETSKMLITNAMSKDEVDVIKENCIKEINKLVLTDNDRICILESYRNWEYHIEDEEEQPEIRYFFGKYDGKYFAMVTGPSNLTWLPEQDSYGLVVDYNIYMFKLLPEIIGICFNGNYYWLNKGTDSEIFGENVITLSQISKIYERYLLIIED